MKKNLAVWTLFGLAFVVNPNLACSSSDDEDFTYSEQQMKSAVLGSWQGTGELDGESVTFTLELQQASSKSSSQTIAPPLVKPQCGSRSFVKPAGACISMSTLPLVATLSSDHPELNVVVEGQAQSYRNLEPAFLELALEDGTTLAGSIEGQALAAGEIRLDQQPRGTFELSRP